MRSALASRVSAGASPRLQYIATSFGYADLYGAKGPRTQSTRRVRFDDATHFRDSLEMAASGGGSGGGGTRAAGQQLQQRVQNLPAHAAEQGRRSSAETGRAARAAASEPPPPARRRSAGRADRGAAAVAAAADKAMRLLANMQIRDGAPGAGRATSGGAVRARGGGAGVRPDTRLGGVRPDTHAGGARPDVRARNGGRVRYETRRGDGGALFTFAVPSGTGGGASAGQDARPRDLASAYMAGVPVAPPPLSPAQAAAAGAAAVAAAQAVMEGRQSAAAVAGARPAPGEAQQHTARRELHYAPANVDGVRVA
eukprot:366127-Chlamydomonas_euryale.AAC.2